MTFLSRLRLHPRDLLVLQDLGDLTEMHRTVMRAFPQHDGESPRAAYGVLFRVEPSSDGTPGTNMLVQSAVEPDWSLLPEGYALGVDVRSLDHALDALHDGARYRFRLVANPSKKTSVVAAGQAPPKHSRRVGLLSDIERLEWLERRADAGGFEVHGLRTDDGPTIADVDPIGRPGPSAVHVRPARFDGLLVVRDAALFRDAVRAGIGPARAYGCGLLSLAVDR